MHKTLSLTLTLLLTLSSHAQLWQGQTSPHTIHLPANPAPLQRLAAQQLQHYLHQISGADLPIQEGGEAPEKTIFIQTDAQANPHLVAYKAQDGNLLISGGSPLSTLYAVYDFLERELGCRFYSPTAEHIPKRESFRLEEITAYQYTPPITTRTVHSQLFYSDSAFARKQRVTHEAFPTYVPGARVHTFHRFLPADRYYEAHPEYYALRNGKRIPTQLCLTNERVFELVKDTVRDMLAANPEARVISVSQDDNTQYCQCEHCEAIHSREESPAGSMIHFVNRIARDFPETQISTLAYQYTRKAPKHIKPEPNVLITLCSIECDRSAPISQKCPDFAADLIAWGEKTDNIRIWDYTTQFTNFLAPFPNLLTLKPNLELFRDNNAKWVFEQHSRQPSELFELRSYLTAKLLWNPASSVDSLMNDFLNGYYGAAAPFVRQYIDTVHQELADEGDFFLFLYGDPSQAFDSYLKPSLLTFYNDLYDKAEAAVEANSSVLQRVQIARLSIDYATLEYLKTHLTQHTATASGRESMHNRLTRFERITQEAGITHLNEMGYSVAEYLTLYKQTLRRAARPNLATGKPVHLLTDPKKYAEEDPQTLTDGAFGSASFYANWLGFEGNHLEAVVDLGEEKEITQLSTAFLQVTNHLVFFPLEVRFYGSMDGEEFALIGTIKNASPLTKESKVNDIQYFTYPHPETKAPLLPIRTRFIKIVGQNMLKAPVWHHGAGLPAWIFMDELEVREN